MRRLFGLVVCTLFVTAAQAASPVGGSVTMYHGDAAHSGRFVAPGLTDRAARHLHRDRRFVARVPGAIYAQPLYWRPAGAAHGMVVVVTERDVVAALDAVTGKTIWQVSVGKAAPRATLACGDIHPLGITGTPVIDARRGALYFDAVVDQAGVAQHLVFGLNLKNGAVLPGWPVSMQAAMRGVGISLDPRIQDQRSALALLDHRLFVAYGGNYGDCGAYRGIVAGLDLARPRVVAGWVTRGDKGGIWAPGGISSAGGKLFFTTGNTVMGATWADGEGVFGLGPDLRGSRNPADYYAPANWKQLDNRDLDISGVGPLPITLAAGQRRVVALGKDGLAYLLDPDDLGGIGGQIAKRAVARSPIIDGAVDFPAGGKMMVAFQARQAVCPDGRFAGGIAAVAIGAGSITPAWCAPFDGRGSPVVTTTDGHAHPILWIDGAQGDDRLHGYDGATGTALYTSARPVPGVREFQTILVADHRLYVAGDGRVFAFRWGGR